jgi:ABC-2 type transport system permease protein
MKHILIYLLEKEFKQIRRDRFLPKIIFAVPILQLLILPFAADFEMHNINLAVIDNDRSVTSTRLTDKILASGYFRLSNLSDNYRQGLNSIENNESDILLEIPYGFERRLARAENATVSIAANAVNGSKGGLSSSYLNAIIQDFNAGTTYPPAQYTAGKIRNTYLFNSHLNYKNYMVPGIIVFLLTLVGGFFSALNIVSEKEKGTIEQINVAPVPKYLFLLSKLIPFWIIGFLLLTLSVLIAGLVYGLTPAGSILTIYLFAAIYLIAFTGFGLAISSISSNRQQAMFTTFFFLIIFALMSGLFTPINSMPRWAQQITLFNPMRYFVEVMRMVYLKGSSLHDIGAHLIAISLFAVAFNALAITGYRKR